MVEEGLKKNRMDLNEMKQWTFWKAEWFAAAGACKAIFWPTPSFKGETIESSGFSAEWILNSAPQHPGSGWEDWHSSVEHPGGHLVCTAVHCGSHLVYTAVHCGSHLVCTAVHWPTDSMEWGDCVHDEFVSPCHLGRHMAVWEDLPPFWADTCQLWRICHHCGRVDAVMQRAFHGWRWPVYNYMAHDNIFV